MKNTIEETTKFTPRYDENGLIPCITQCADTGIIYMFAYMNEEALRKTLETGEVHYWSRSRNELWHKGATSGEIQKLIRLETDCDQDVVLAHVRVKAGKACHTGRKTCFYREVNLSDRGRGDDLDVTQARLKHLSE